MFKEVFLESDELIKANGTTYKVKATVASRGDKYSGKTFHIIATPKDKSNIIAFDEPLQYVGNPGEFYLAMLGWTTGYDNGYDRPTQTTPNLSYEGGYLDVLKKALEGKRPEYKDITYTFPKGTKLSIIKNQMSW